MRVGTAMLVGTALHNALQTLTPAQFSGKLYRATLLEYLLLPGSTLPLDVTRCHWSNVKGQRYTTIGGAPCLYMSITSGTPLIEINHVLDPYIAPTVSFTLEAELDSILDLTDPANIATLRLSQNDLECEWDILQDQGDFVPTHCIAEAVIASGKFHAIKYQSVRDPEGINIVIYCDLVYAPNFVEVVDTKGNIIGRISNPPP